MVSFFLTETRQCERGSRAYDFWRLFGGYLGKLKTEGSPANMI